MSWEPVGKLMPETGKTAKAPLVMNSQYELYSTLLGGAIDDMSSDPRTLDFLSSLIAFMDPKILVEVGTYRGIGAVCFGETLRFHDLPGHLWTCDPVDYDVDELLTKTGLADRITFVRGRFEDLLAQLPGPIDFCYLDAAAHPGSGRLTYTRLAKKHLAPGGVLAVDDVAGDWPGAKTLRRMASMYLPPHRGLALFIQ